MTLGTWWITWGDLIRKLAAWVSLFASILALLIEFLPPPRELPWWVIALLVVASVAFIAVIVLEVKERRRRHVFARNDTRGIRSYMHAWVEHGGRVAIWTRDMSWAQNPQTRKILTEKARRKELILCLPELNQLATELANAGAEVCAYGAKLMELPVSRFTIAFFGRDGSRVAVGHADGDLHVIDEFEAGAHPAFYLAADVISLARALRAKRD